MGIGQNCHLMCLSMILEIPYDDLVKELGYDGNEICWTLKDGSTVPRGFHNQEVIDCCLKRDLALCPIELYPSLGPPDESQVVGQIYHNVGSDYHNQQRFDCILRDKMGILIGEVRGKRCYSGGVRHAVAWDKGKMVDPRYGLATSEVNDFYIQECWIVCKI